jgi:hypothetical protein
MLMVSDIYFEWGQTWTAYLRAPAFLFLVVSLILLTFELWTTHATDDAHTVAKMITRGQFSRQFWLGMVLVGHMLPLFLIAYGGRFTSILAGVLILAGMYVGERIWVRAPQLIPLS